MKYQGSNLVRVTSHDELRVEMMIFFACRCGKFHGALLMGMGPRGLCAGPRGGINRKCKTAGWRLAGCVEMERYAGGRTYCLGCSLKVVRLYRLQEPPAEVNDYDVVAVPAKAKERTR